MLSTWEDILYNNLAPWWWKETLTDLYCQTTLPASEKKKRKQSNQRPPSAHNQFKKFWYLSELCGEHSTMAAVSAKVLDPNAGLPQDDKNSNASFGSLRTRRRSSHSLSLLTIPENRLQGSSSCPVYQRPNSFNAEETVEEGCELFQHFVIDQITKEGLKPPEECFSPTVVRWDSIFFSIPLKLELDTGDGVVCCSDI